MQYHAYNKLKLELDHTVHNVNMYLSKNVKLQTEILLSSLKVFNPLVSINPLLITFRASYICVYGPLTFSNGLTSVCPWLSWAAGDTGCRSDATAAPDALDFGVCDTQRLPSAELKRTRDRVGQIRLRREAIFPDSLYSEAVSRQLLFQVMFSGLKWGSASFLQSLPPPGVADVL